MSINSSKQVQEPKLGYQTPKLEQHTQWQPLIQTISLPGGPGTSVSVETSLFWEDLDDYVY